jgi:hypothetical protein
VRALTSSGDVMRIESGFQLIDPLFERWLQQTGPSAGRRRRSSPDEKSLIRLVSMLAIEANDEWLVGRGYIKRRSSNSKRPETPPTSPTKSAEAPTQRPGTSRGACGFGVCLIFLPLSRATLGEVDRLTLCGLSTTIHSWGARAST